jgi:hypothetical protein
VACLVAGITPGVVLLLFGIIMLVKDILARRKVKEENNDNAK